jgi:hypothetical protein
MTFSSIILMYRSHTSRSETLIILNLTMLSVWGYPVSFPEPNLLQRKMIFRFILRYLANNQQLVDKLADSYPMRRAAQWVLYLYSRSKAITEKRNLNTDSIEDSLKKLKEKLENELKK